MAYKVLQTCRLCLHKPLRWRSVKTMVSSTRDLQTKTKNETETADIVISGGGMVGAAMACSLGQSEMLREKKIILLESAKRQEVHLTDRYNSRVCALSGESVNLLTNLGAWDEIVKMRCQPVKRMQVWDSCSDSIITFSHDGMDGNLAYIVENNVILEAITRRLEALGNRVDVRYQSKAKSYNLITEPSEKSDLGDQSCLGLELEDGTLLQSRLLIGADGFRSAVRAAANIHITQWDYRQMAVVAILKISEMENNVAWQRFLPTGPIAMLPLTNTLSCLIWTNKTEGAKNLRSFSDEHFIDAVNDAFWHDRDRQPLAVKASDIFQNVMDVLLPGDRVIRQLPPTVVGVQEDSRAAFPLSLIHASKYVGPRLALIGDAAHRVHPLAGQGVNLGFGDVACLTQKIVDAVHNGYDIGSLKHLSNYETLRQRAVLPVMATVDGLQKLYSTDLLPIVMVRSLGLQATNSLHFLKKFIVNKATAGT